MRAKERWFSKRTTGEQLDSFIRRRGRNAGQAKPQAALRGWKESPAMYLGHVVIEPNKSDPWEVCVWGKHGGGTGRE